MNALVYAAAGLGVLWYFLLTLVTARWLARSLPDALGERTPPQANFYVLMLVVAPIAIPVFLSMCVGTGLKIFKTPLF